MAWIAFVAVGLTRPKPTADAGILGILAAAVLTLRLAYMVQCDRAREAVVQLGDRAALVPPDLTPLQRRLGPGLLAVVGLLMATVSGLACWQFWEIMQPRQASGSSE
jgi:hypothetical protein